MSEQTPNPSNLLAPNDIARLNTTDYRPSKQIYSNVMNNNHFRLYMQRNANEIRRKQLDEFEKKMGACGCEEQPKEIKKFEPGYTCKK
jgi:hypothetical protein